MFWLSCRRMSVGGSYYSGILFNSHFMPCDCKIILESVKLRIFKVSLNFCFFSSAMLIPKRISVSPR